MMEEEREGEGGRVDGGVRGRWRGEERIYDR